MDTYDLDAPQLTLEGVPGPIAQGTMFAPEPAQATHLPVSCVACGYVSKWPVAVVDAGMAPDRCPRCIRLDVRPGTLTSDDPAAPTVAEAVAEHGLGAGLVAHHDDARRARVSRDEHRSRCGGPIMAPVFGLGRRSCAVCDWSPDD